MSFVCLNIKFMCGKRSRFPQDRKQEQAKVYSEEVLASRWSPGDSDVHLPQHWIWRAGQDSWKTAKKSTFNPREYFICEFWKYNNQKSIRTWRITAKSLQQHTWNELKRPPPAPRFNFNENHVAKMELFYDLTNRAIRGDWKFTRHFRKNINHWKWS